jgi:hypothetical protein
MSRTTEMIYGLPGGQGVIINVDEAIYTLLTYEKGDSETYNDVVRRLLGMPPAC